MAKKKFSREVQKKKTKKQPNKRREERGELGIFLSMIQRFLPRGLGLNRAAPTAIPVTCPEGSSSQRAFKFPMITLKGLGSCQRAGVTPELLKNPTSGRIFPYYYLSSGRKWQPWLQCPIQRGATQNTRNFFSLCSCCHALAWISRFPPWKFHDPFTPCLSLTLQPPPAKIPDVKLPTSPKSWGK